MNSNVFVSVADSFPKAIKMWKQNMNCSYFSQEREKSMNTTNVRVNNTLVGEGFELWWIALYRILAVKE